MSFVVASELPAGAGRAAVGTWRIVSPVGEPPRRVFRRVLHLRIEGAAAERVVVAPDTARLDGVFRPLDFDGLVSQTPSSSPPYRAARLVERAGGVRVELDAPRAVTALRLSGTDVTSVGLHRVDGEAVSQQPTAVLDTTSGLTGSSRSLTGTAPFTDARFVLRNPDVELDVGRILELRLRSPPTNARLGVADPDELDAATVVWQAPGEADGEVPLAAGSELAKELNRHLERRFDAQAGHLDVALVIEADAPCLLRLDALELPFHLETASFAAGGDKEVLRFDGDPLVRRELGLRLPADAKILSATLPVVESLAPGGPPGGEEPPPAAPTADREGIGLHLGHWVGQRIEPDAATISAILLGVMGLTGRLRLGVELREDVNGLPAGRQVASGEVDVVSPGVARWSTLRFDRSLVLPGGPFWILVRPTEGRGVWLTEPGGVITVLESTRPGTPWKIRHRHSDRMGQFRVLGSSGAAVRLTVGGEDVAPRADSSDPLLFDLVDALGRVLAAASVGETVDVPLVFTSAVPGFLTVRAPRLEFQVSSLQTGHLAQ